MILSSVKELRTNKNIIESIWAIFSAVFSRLSIFFIILINTQFFNAKDFGIFSVLLLIGNTLSAMVSCGGDMWLNRFTRHHHSVKGIAPLVSRFYLQISIGVASIATVIVFLSCFIKNDLLFEHRMSIIYSMIWAVANGLIETLLAILRTTGNIKRFFIIRDIVMPAVLILGIFIFSIHSVTSFFLCASCLSLIVLVLLLKFMFDNKNIYLVKSPNLTWKKMGPELISYSLKLILNNVSSRLCHSIDVLILTYYIAIDMIGKYRLAAQFSNAFQVIQHYIFLALPWHMRLTKGIGFNDGLKTVQFRYKIWLAMAGFAFIALLIAIKIVTSINIMENSSEVAIVVMLFLLIRFTELLWGPQHEMLISNNKIYEDTLGNIVGLLIGVSSFFIIIQFFDYMMSGIISAGLNSFCTRFAKFMFLKKQNNHKSQAINSNKYLPWLPLILIITGLSYAAI